MKHYEDLIQRLRTATKLPLLQALMDEAADAIEALVGAEKRKTEKNAPLTDYISREAFKAEIRRLSTHYLNEWDTLGVLAAADRIPAADVRPVVLGKWIDRDDKYYGWNMWACSACGEEFVLTEGTPDMNEYHFCPNCGADMREA